MDIGQRTTLVLITLSFLVVGAGLTAIVILQNKSIEVEMPSTVWESIEQDVENDVGLMGYRFLKQGTSIPAIDELEYQRCLSTYVDLQSVGQSYSREYLFKYNQIVRIRMLRAGIDCREG